jgi:hypothetical protein
MALRFRRRSSSFVSAGRKWGPVRRRRTPSRPRPRPVSPTPAPFRPTAVYLRGWLRLSAMIWPTVNRARAKNERGRCGVHGKYPAEVCEEVVSYVHRTIHPAITPSSSETSGLRFRGTPPARQARGLSAPHSTR